uniref:ABC1 atypical kinase-like domain-containing protein n=1 Tax=Chromera velia CCMP2878 TaxID=1169474 RepID=A0A0G4I8C5_9ALVE|eukprot:Cvel_11907.t1-p1 / transcript=Cvel_11907.t1 / gene=Cvel_11907 / organism=Chromera_velia_CCMP2878 / gene_product=Uncharacterized protein sll1770, putative / transcript_product=Uncharacterized protein sll1770, putative / location=Cvel_scaffold762:23199-34430(+) / protein_length=875 / sequence_SO=supercontig / SO=protein_coding / is_pseudo=false
MGGLKVLGLLILVKEGCSFLQTRSVLAGISNHQRRRAVSNPLYSSSSASTVEVSEEELKDAPLAVAVSLQNVTASLGEEQQQEVNQGGVPSAVVVGEETGGKGAHLTGETETETGHAHMSGSAHMRTANGIPLKESARGGQTGAQVGKGDGDASVSSTSTEESEEKGDAALELSGEQLEGRKEVLEVFEKRGGKKGRGSWRLFRWRREGKKERTLEEEWIRGGRQNPVTRTISIFSFVLRLGLRELAVLRQKDSKKKKQMREKAAEQTVKEVIRLGPSFIKLGQLLSARSGDVPKEYLQELQKLQDGVDPFSFETVKEIVEEDLGRPLLEVFEEFDEVPIAAASLAQVHRAKLNGVEVAVKVQRANLKKLFDQDLRGLRAAVALFDRLDPKSDGTDRNWVEVFEQSRDLLYDEIDFRKEMAANKRFQSELADVSWIKSPKVYEKQSGPRVLTMEYVRSAKITDVETLKEWGLDLKRLAELSARSFLLQILRTGFFHCDPHPGNVHVNRDGQIVYFDFGMMDCLTPQTRDGLREGLRCLYGKDPVGVTDALQGLQVIKRGADRTSVERIARKAVQGFAGARKGRRMRQLMTRYPFLAPLLRALPMARPPPGTPGGPPLETSDDQETQSEEEQMSARQKFRQGIGEDLLNAKKETPFNFPPQYTFVIRALLTLTGIGKTLDPNYDLPDIAERVVEELDDRDPFAEKLNRALDEIRLSPKALKSVFQFPEKVAYVEKTVRKMEEGDLKIRVRVLESERAFERAEIAVSALGKVASASVLLNLGLYLRLLLHQSSSVGGAGGAVAAAAGAGAGGASVASSLFGLLEAAGVPLAVLRMPSLSWGSFACLGLALFVGSGVFGDVSKLASLRKSAAKFGLQT